MYQPNQINVQMWTREMKIEEKEEKTNYLP